MLDEADAALARLLLPDVPVLLDTSFQILAQGLFNEDPVCPQEADTQSNIQQEQTQQELQQELNANFALTVKLFGGAQGATCEKCCACAVWG